MKIIKWSILVLILVGMGCYFYITSKHPVRSGELQLPGLSAPVTVTFDEFGIPHIVADNDNDMYRAFGYIHAQDRLFQMDLIRRLGRGRLAEWFGPEVVKVDRLFRTLQIEHYTSKWMANYLETGPDKTVQAINAYLAGVNQFIARGATPIEYALISADKEPFTTDDMAAVLGFTAFQFTIGMNQDIMVNALAASLTEAHIDDLGIRWQPGATLNEVDPRQSQALSSLLSDITDMITPGGLFIGSNGWVLSGSKTESGKPLLVNDPHMGFAQPSVWYEAHLKSPESEIYGHHLALVPFALLGHNEDIAWGLTMFLNDDVDLYKERLNPENSNQYWVNGAWRAFEVSQEIIQIKGEEPLELTIRSSHHGPIVNEAYALFDDYENSFAEAPLDDPLAMSWLFYHPDNNLIDPLYELARSKTPAQAATAVAKIYSPGLNVMYADKNDNIAWWASARLIQRPDHVNASMVLDGASGNDEPLGLYDFSYNPKILNPDKGYLFTANNQPADTGIGLIPGYYVGRDRAKRIEELLSTDRKFTVSDMKSMLLDDVSTSALMLKEKGLPLLNQNSPNLAHPEYLRLLNEWDGSHATTAIEPTIYYTFKKQLLTEIFKDEMGEHYFDMFLAGFLRQKTYWKILNSPTSPWWDNVSTTDSETMVDTMTAAWNHAMEKLRNSTQFNPQKMQWQYHMNALHQHPFGLNENLAGIFNIGPYPVAGGNETVNNMIFKLNDEPFIAIHGPSTRRIIDFNDFSNSWGINPTGQSGVVTDKHYDDQAQMYHKGEFRPQILSSEQLNKAETTTLIFSP